MASPMMTAAKESQGSTVVHGPNTTSAGATSPSRYAKLSSAATPMAGNTLKAQASTAMLVMPTKSGNLGETSTGEQR